MKTVGYFAVYTFVWLVLLSLLGVVLLPLGLGTNSTVMGLWQVGAIIGAITIGARRTGRWRSERSHKPGVRFDSKGGVGQRFN